jgi:hypothetical protein
VPCRSLEEVVLAIEETCNSSSGLVSKRVDLPVPDLMDGIFEVQQDQELRDQVADELAEIMGRVALS